jgi:hypothetical protein
MYRDETLLDLYNRVSHHFGSKDIKGLYIDSHLHKNTNTNTNINININDASFNEINNEINNDNNNCCKKTANMNRIPVSSLTTVSQFIFDNTAKKPRNLEPVYKLPFPVVYRIYLDDGHCHCC